MHPFYWQNSLLLSQDSTWWAGIISMGMYLLFWGVVIFIAARMARKYLAGSGSLKFKEDTAVKILRERYARGEIEFEEFVKKKEDLEKYR